MPYPTEKPQAAAPSADLMAHNNISTGATLTGGALAGDAGGMASSHTSAAPAAASPAFPTPPAQVWHGYDAGPPPKFLCPDVDCRCAKAKRHWRLRPVFSGKQRLDTHYDIHRPAGEKKYTVICPHCGVICSRGDMSYRHINKCKGPQDDDSDVGGMGGASASSQAGPSHMAA